MAVLLIKSRNKIKSSPPIGVLKRSLHYQLAKLKDNLYGAEVILFTIASMVKELVAGRL